MLSEDKIYWPNGKLKRAVQFSDSIRFGYDRMWNEEGVLVDESFYENGKPKGTHRRWSGNGVLIEEIIYKDDKRFDFRNWDETGSLRTEAIWLDETHYKERAFDRFQNKWTEKTGIWNGHEIEYPKTASIKLLSPKAPKGKADQNAAKELLQKRFPKLALLLSSPIEAPFEGLLSADPGKAEAVFVYGLGGGAPYFQLQNWMKEDPKRQLVFLEDEIGHIAHFLKSFASLIALSDPQVHIELIEDDLSKISEKFPIHRIEMYSTPSKRGRRFVSLKQKLFAKIALSHALHVDRLHGYQHFQNFLKNMERVPSSFYANALRGAFKGMPAIVCGAGPSLNAQIPLLKTLKDRALIIAGGSAIAALSSQGVPIHFGMAIDPNLEEYRRMKNSFALNTPILYSTRVHPGIFQTMNGPFGYMRSGIGGILEVWMEEELNLLDPLIGQNLSPESISVTAICTAFAEFVGCNTILFAGVDLAYADQKRYAAGVDGDDEKISFCELDEEKTAADRILLTKDVLGKPVYTATRWLMEAKSLGDYAKKHPSIRFINTSEKGLHMPKIPNMSMQEAAETYLKQSFPMEDLVKNAIEKSPMPKECGPLIQERMEELSKSLNQVIEHLEVITGQKKGSKALAEIELKEELAMDLFFYDAFEVLGKEKSPQSIWELLLQLAKKYQRVSNPVQ